MARRSGRLIQAVSAFIALALQVDAASACACCSEVGHRIIGEEKIEDYVAEIVGGVRFGNEAGVVGGERDASEIEGLKTVSHRWKAKVVTTKGRWTFEFIDSAGNRGDLLFDIPRVFYRFEVDPRDPAGATNPGGPPIYKEWRMTSKAVGSGMLAASVGGEQKATVILHGRGNLCTEIESFTAWTIELRGAKARNTIYGGLVTQ